MFLSKYFLKSIKTQYNLSSINIYIIYFKHDRYTFLYKYLKLQKILLEKINYRKNYGLKTITKKISKTVMNFSPFFLTSKKLSLSFKNFLLKNYTKQIFLLYEKKIASNTLCIIPLKIQTSFFWHKKLKFLNELLKLKGLGLHCSLVLYLYTKNKFFVNLKSITEKYITLLHTPFSFKYVNNTALIQKIFIILISFIFVKANILNTYIITILKKTKNKKHIKNLVSFFSGLKIIFEKQMIPLLGLKFRIAGRLDGKLRKASYHYKLGFLQLLSLNLTLDYSYDTLYTPYGSFSLKL